jgi:hypothetical protein
VTHPLAGRREEWIEMFSDEITPVLEGLIPAWGKIASNLRKPKVIPVATEVPRRAKLDLPSWFWGGDIPSYFRDARLRATHDDATGVVTVETEERATRERPKLVRTTELFGLSVTGVAPPIGELEADTLRSLGMPSIVRRVDLDAHLQRLLARASAPSSSVTSLAAGLAAHQLQTTAAATPDLDETIRVIVEDIKAIALAESGEAAFPNASVFTSFSATKRCFIAPSSLLCCSAWATTTRLGMRTYARP